MKNSKSKILVLTVIASVSAGACSRERADSQERTLIPSLAELAGGSLRNGQEGAEPIPPVASPLLREEASACERLEELQSMPFHGARYSVFSYLGAADEGAGVSGAIDVRKSPFTQLFMGETFKLDTPDEFYDKARAEYKAGRLSRIKWYALKAARLFPDLFRKLQLSATNEKIAEGFPGIFGQAGPVEGSLFYKLAARSGGLGDGRDAAELRDLSSILSADLPLFAGRRWEGSAEDFRESYAAAAASLGKSAESHEGRRERLCGFVLWQRAFAQLLAMKGYRSLRPQDEPAGRSFAPVSDEAATRVPVGGAFIVPGTYDSVVLDAELIQSYDPANGSRLAVVSRPPEGFFEGMTGSLLQSAGNVDTQLSVLETLVHAFEATSPAGPWFEGGERRYILGDLVAEGSRALVPHETHSLALGLMVMSFKNVAALNIVKVNAAGTRLSGNQSAAGIALLDDPGASREEIPLRRVLKLIRASAYLEQALGKLAARDAAHWSARSPVYTEKLLAQLAGADAASLKSSLGKLTLPLALLALQYSGPSGECRLELDWDLETGKRVAQGRCDRELEAEYRSALELLGQQAQSPLLIRRAKAR